MIAIFHLRRRRRPALHVLVFGLRWPPETFLRSKLERLAERGIRITVAAGKGEHADPSSRIRVVPADPIGTGGWKGTAAAGSILALLFLRSPRRAAAVARAARRPNAAGRAIPRREAAARVGTYARLALLRPDVVHFEWSTGAVQHHALADALGCPAVVSLRGTGTNVHPHVPSMAVPSKGTSVALGRAAVVHCVSEAIRREAMRHGLDPANARVIRPAVDAAFFRPSPTRAPSSSSYRLVAAGMLRWVKGYDYALLAVAELASEGVPVSLEILGGDPPPPVGEPSELDRLRATVADLGLESRVTLRGAVDQADVRAALERADVLVHTSLAEGLPNVVLEAMACGVPVVATDVGGTREAVTNGTEGFLVPARDAGAVATVLRDLWREPALRVQLGEAGRRRVESDFTLERQTDAWVDLYEQAARAARPPARRFRLVEIGVRWPPETFVQRKLRNLAARGVDAHIVPLTPPESTPAVAGVARDSVSVAPEKSSRAGVAWDGVRLLLRHPRRFRALVAAWRRDPGPKPLVLWQLYLRLARLRADVVHFEWLPTAARFLPLIEACPWPVTVSCRGAQVQVRPHTPRGERERLRELLPRVFDRAVAVHCVSETVVCEARRFGLGPEKVWLIRSGVDAEFFRPPAFARGPGGDFTVVSVGWLRWVKGFEYALLAVAALRRDGSPATLEIHGADPPPDSGEPTERPRLQRAIAELGLESSIRLVGGSGPDQVRAALQRADVFLQTSLSEGLPNVLLEAMACGVPVVATNVGGTDEAVRDGVEGFLIPARDAEAAAARLATLYGDPSLRARMGAAGRRRVTSAFTTERETQGWLALCESVADRRAA